MKSEAEQGSYTRCTLHVRHKGNRLVASMQNTQLQLYGRLMTATVWFGFLSAAADVSLGRLLQTREWERMSTELRHRLHDSVCALVAVVSCDITVSLSLQSAIYFYMFVGKKREDGDN